MNNSETASRKPPRVRNIIIISVAVLVFIGFYGSVALVMLHERRTENVLYVIPSSGQKLTITVNGQATGFKREQQQRYERIYLPDNRPENLVAIKLEDGSGFEQRFASGKYIVNLRHDTWASFEQLIYQPLHEKSRPTAPDSNCTDKLGYGIHLVSREPHAVIYDFETPAPLFRSVKRGQQETIFKLRLNVACGQFDLSDQSGFYVTQP